MTATETVPEIETKTAPKGYLLIENGTSTFVPHPEKLSLEEIQKVVDGYVQLVPRAPPGYTLHVDEDGKLKKKPRTAQALWLPGEWGLMVGPILVCGRAWGNPLEEAKLTKFLKWVQIFPEIT